MGTTNTGNTVLEQHLAAETVHDPEAAAATYHEECWYENAALGLRFEGRDMVSFQYATSWGFIPDMAARYDWELDLGDTIVQCGRITGTAGPELLGVPAVAAPSTSSSPRSSRSVTGSWPASTSGTTSTASASRSAPTSTAVRAAAAELATVTAPA